MTDKPANREALPLLPLCDICRDHGFWISKEGAEIPCDFCLGPDDSDSEGRSACLVRRTAKLFA